MLVRTCSILVAALVMLAACGTQRLPPGNASYGLDSGIEYKLGPGDKVRVTVFGEPQLSGEHTISNNGDIALPLVGAVKAGGLNPTMFQAALTEKLLASGMVLQPRVAVGVIEYRPFYILGEVKAPGTYPYTIGLTVTKAVATSGGFTYRANERQAYITREGQSQESALPITAATWIGPGDTVRIVPRAF